DGAERQIQNVAPGVVDENSTDAINGSQLYATNQQVDENSKYQSHYYSVNSTDTGVGSNYDNDGATGIGALAAGAGTSASGDLSTATGAYADASDLLTTANGAFSVASAKNATALGARS